ncbi:unnamed protein product (macronuclear) [Paramecium tetraurelia]|uniref:NACHT domain-containing protein n=1 Tax=Paramecium tetraurelia TaxID=5888 RepID=A0E6D5_PARTE|nr:uncharacterized protein GSPATT00003717001 [Paramecium tetraurelia]CAK90852.1 unnamed protein product [Paramecium tetraurelia]|eukprot:XP_001458249.1 hypothetical protein (macronuclear) [Paramecium tetraurelia strain d4-2]
MQLRGGGVGCMKYGNAINTITPHNNQSQVEQQAPPPNLQNQIIFHSNRIAKNAVTAVDKKNDLMNSFQFFFIHERQLWEQAKHPNQQQENIDLILECLNQLLPALKIFIQSNHLYALFTSQLICSLIWVIFTFYSTKKERILKVQQQQQYLTEIEQIYERLEIESEGSKYQNNIEYELFVIRAVLFITPTDSQEGSEILSSFCQGAFSSLTSFTLDDKLIESLKKGVVYLYQQGVKYSRMKKLEIIFSLMSLKFDAMNKLEESKETNAQSSKSKVVAELLGKMYCNVVKESSDWEIWYCWIQTLSSLFQFKPVVQKLNLEESLKSEILNKDYVITTLGDQKILSLKYSIIQTDINSKKVFNSSTTLQELAQLQNFILNGYDQLSNYEQQYFIKLQALDEQKQNNQPQLPITLSRISQLLNQVQSLQSTFIEFNEIVMSQDFTDQQKLKQSEKLMKESQMKIIASLQEIEHLDTLKTIIQDSSQSRNSQSIYFDDYYQIQQTNCQIYLMRLADFEKDKYQKTSKSVDYIKIIEELIQSSKKDETINKTFEDFKKQQNDKGNIMNLQNSLKSLVCKKEKSLNFQQDDYLLGLIQAINLNQQWISNLEWNLQNCIILQIYLRMLLQEQNNDRDSNLKESIIRIANQHISYQSLSQSIKFLYNQYFNCECIFFKKFSRPEQKSKSNLEKLLITLLIDNFDAKNTNLSILSIHLFSERSSDKNVKFDLEISKMMEEEMDQSISYINQVQSALKMIIDYLQYEDGANKEVTDELGYLKDTKCINEVKQKLNENYINSQECLQKLQNYFEKFKQIFTSLETSIKDTDQGFYEYLNQKLNQLDQLIVLFTGLVELCIINKKDEELVKQIKEDIGEKLNQLIGQTYVKNDNLNIQLNNTIQDEIEFYKNIHSELEELRQKLEKQLNQVKDTEKELQQIQKKQKNVVTLEKLQKQNNSYDTVLKDTKDEITQSLRKLQQEQTTIELDISKIKEKLSQIQKIQHKKDIESQLHFILVQIESKEKQCNYFEQQYDKIKEEIVDILQNNKWRIRQVIIYELQQMKQFCLSENTINLSSGLLVKFSVFETNKKIRLLFNNQGGQESLKILSHYWPSQEQMIQNKIKEKIKELNDIAQKLTIETSTQLKIKYQKEYGRLEKEIQGILGNVENIGNQLEITILFFQDLKQDLLRIENQIKQLQEAMESINKDLKFLKGRSVKELFEMRMKRVLQQRLVYNSDNVYIQILTKEKILLEDKEDNETLLFTEDLFGNGEINEFIWKQQKDSLLIHGQAGSGKSTAARKIEEFLWLIYQKNKNQTDYIPLIPIFVSLPQLKDPIYCAIEETLRSDNYRFSERQVEELKEALEQKKYRLIIIMDSYDELKQQYIGMNLNLSNRISKWRCSSDKNKYPKVITTSRSELFTIKGYGSWFLSESNDPNYYKEVRLLKFTENQIKQYIQEYTFLSVKRIIKEFYFAAYQDQDYQEFENVYVDIIKTVGLLNIKQDKQQMLSQDIIESLILKCKHFVSTEHQKSLAQMLMEIWSSWKYENFIKLMGLEQVIETPFMVEIVMAVLPYVVKQRQEINNIKENFIKKYVYLSKYSDSLQKQALDEWQGIVNNQQFLTKFIQEFQISEQEKMIKQYFQNNQSFNIIEKALLLEPLSTYDFYIQFLEHYFKRQINKLRETGEQIDFDSIGNQLWEFAHKLANEMTFNNLSQVPFQPGGLVFKKEDKDWRDDFFNDDCQEGTFKRLFRKCIPIRQKSGIYSFNHKSLQEFLVAKWFIEQLVKLDVQEVKLELEAVKKDQQAVKQDQQGQEKPVKTDKDKQKQLVKYNFFQKSWDFDYMQGPIRFIINKINFNEELKQKLMNIIYFSRYHDDFIIGSSNSLYLLNLLGQQFIETDFQKIKIKQVSLNNANFFRCNFNYSIFNKVKLSGVNLNNTEIKTATWDILIDELPKIETNIGIANQIIYIEEENIFLVHDRIQVKQYNLNQFQEERKLNIDFKPKFIVLSNNQKLLAMINRNEALIFDITSNKAIQKLNFGDCFSEYKETITFGPDDQSIILGGSDGADELKLILQYENIPEVKQQNQNMKSKHAPKSNLKMKTNDDNNDEKDIMQEQISIQQTQMNKMLKVQPDSIVALDQINSLTKEKVYELKCAKVVILQHYNKFSIYYQKETKKELEQYDSKLSQLICSDVNRDSTLVAFGGDKGEIIVFQISSVDINFSLSGHKEQISQIQFSTDGKQLVSCSCDKTIKLWNIQQKNLISQTAFILKPKVYSLCLVNNSNLALTGFADGLVQLWDLENSDSTIDANKGHQAEITCAIFSLDGSFIISGSADKMIKIWNTRSGLQEGQNLIKHKQTILSLAISDDPQLLCSGSLDGDVYLWDFKSQKFLKQINLFGSQVCDIKIIKYNDGQRILTQTNECIVQLWQESLNEFYLLYNYTDVNKRCISGKESKEILLQSKNSHIPQQEFRNLAYDAIQQHKISSIGASIDGLVKLIGTNQGTLLIVRHDLRSEQKKPKDSEPISIIKTLSSKYFLTISAQHIFVWKFSDFSVKESLLTENTIINDVLVNEDSFFCAGNLIEIWAISSQTKVQKKIFIPNATITSIGYDQKNTTIYAGLTNGNIVVIDQLTDVQKQIQHAHSKEITSIHWLKTRDMLITGGDDLTLKLWSSDLRVIKEVEIYDTLVSTFISSNEIYMIVQEQHQLSIWDLEKLEHVENMITIQKSAKVMLSSSTQQVFWTNEQQISSLPVMNKKIYTSYMTEKQSHNPEFMANTEKMIITADRKGNLFMWDNEGQKIDEKRTDKNNELRSIHLSNDQTKIVCAFKNIITIVDLQKKQEIFNKDVSNYDITRALYLTNNDLLFVTNSEKSQVIKFSITEPKTETIISNHTGKTLGAATTKDSCFLTYGSDQAIRYYIEQQQCKFVFSSLLRFECEGAQIKNSNISFKSQIDLKVLFKQKKAILE